MTTPTAPPVLENRSRERAGDLAAIAELLAGVEEGVNARDADRCVARFAADTRSVTAAGRRAVGREAVRAAHESAFAVLGAARARFVLLDVAFPRDDVAVATTGAWSADDPAALDLDRPATVVVYVLVREPDGWWVASRQFTRVASP
ncbi:MAG: hypothetical protein QOK35_1305 [Pseudonocardiales bacterium]|nr:hypothetical protein [Pseudonocardiales bacterium]